MTLNEQFATDLLKDRAVRSKQTLPDRIIFLGNHMSLQFIRPVRGNRESLTAYFARLELWRTSILRDSDQKRRWALASEALQRDGHTGLSAAVWIRDKLDEASLNSEELTRKYAKYRAYHPIKFKIGTTRRGYRTTERRSSLTPRELEAETIRVTANRYKSKCQDFDDVFEMELRCFLWQLPLRDRTPKWYAEIELSYKSVVDRREHDLGLGHQLVGEAAFVLGCLYHEQSKYREAQRYYRQAWGIWIGESSHHPLFRNVLLHYAAVAIGTSAQGQPVPKVSDYRGPRFVRALLT